MYLFISILLTRKLFCELKNKKYCNSLADTIGKLAPTATDYTVTNIHLSYRFWWLLAPD